MRIRQGDDSHISEQWATAARSVLWFPATALLRVLENRTKKENEKQCVSSEEWHGDTVPFTETIFSIISHRKFPHKDKTGKTKPKLFACLLVYPVDSEVLVCFQGKEQTKNRPDFNESKRFFLELVTGVEPATHWLQISCAAIAPH